MLRKNHEKLIVQKMFQLKRSVSSTSPKPFQHKHLIRISKQYKESSVEKTVPVNNCFLMLILVLPAATIAQMTRNFFFAFWFKKIQISAINLVTTYRIYYFFQFSAYLTMMVKLAEKLDE